jgi:hypothetical protein
VYQLFHEQCSTDLPAGFISISGYKRRQRLGRGVQHRRRPQRRHYKCDLLYGISAGHPLSRRISAKIGYVGSRTEERIGDDTDSIALAISFRL